MTKRHTVTLHHVITVYNDLSDYMAGVMRSLANKKTEWKDDLFFAIKLARQKLSKYQAEVTPTTGMLLLSAQIINPDRKMRLFRKWEMGMYMNPENETFDTTQSQEAFQKYVKNEYCTKYRRVLVNKLKTIQSSNLVPPGTASGSYQLLFDPYDSSSDDEEYVTPNNVAETTPRQSDHTAHLLTATRLNLNSLSEAQKNWGQINPNLNDYHSDPMDVSSTFWIPDITDWWHHREETHSTYTNLSNVARDIFSIIPHGIGVKASFSLGRDVIG